MKPGIEKGLQHLVLAAIQLIDVWEDWTDNETKGAVKVFHESLIRLSKGMVKATRLLLIDIKQESQPDRQAMPSVNQRAEARIKGVRHG